MIRKRSAFTLIELLVVIGIIALLVSILMPSLKKARAMAVRAQCLSNLRQVHMAMMMYANDNKGIIPRQRLGNDGGAVSLWPSFIIEGLDGNGGAGHPKYLNNYKVAICPSAFSSLEGSPIDMVNATGGNQAYGLWDPNGATSFHSLFIYPTGVPFPSQLWTLRPEKLKSAGYSQTQTIMLADASSQQSGWSQFMTASFNKNGSTYFSSIIHAFHAKRANVLFFDGHAASLTGRELRYETDTKATRYKQGSNFDIVYRTSNDQIFWNIASGLGTYPWGDPD